MTQMVVTLENGADSTLIQRMIENIKGVMRVSTKLKKEDTVEKWIEDMRSLSDSVDPSVVDLADDKTRYLMSK